MVRKDIWRKWRCSDTHFLMDVSRQVDNLAALPPRQKSPLLAGRSNGFCLRRRFTQRHQLIPVHQTISTTFQISYASFIQQVAGNTLMYRSACKLVTTSASAQFYIVAAGRQDDRQITLLYD